MRRTPASGSEPVAAGRTTFLLALVGVPSADSVSVRGSACPGPMVKHLGADAEAGFSTVISCLPGDTVLDRQRLARQRADLGAVEHHESLLNVGAHDQRGRAFRRQRAWRRSAARTIASTARASPRESSFSSTGFSTLVPSTVPARRVNLLQREHDVAARALDVAVDQLGRAQALAACARQAGASSEQEKTSLISTRSLPGISGPPLPVATRCLSASVTSLAQVVCPGCRSPRRQDHRSRCHRRRAPARPPRPEDDGDDEACGPKCRAATRP